MLERMLPDGALQAGIYAQGFRFFESLNMFGFLVAGLLLPMFSRMLKQGADTGPLTGLALRLVLSGTSILAMTLTWPPHCAQVSIPNTRLRRWVQLIARCRSAGVRRFGALGFARPAGVTSARHRLCGANTPW